LVVVYAFMDSRKDMTEPIQDTSYQAFSQWGKVWNFQRGKLCGLFMMNADKWGAKIKKWGRCQLAIA